MVAIHCQHIEGAELYFLIVPARMQRIEIGVAVDADTSRRRPGDQPPQ